MSCCYIVHGAWRKLTTSLLSVFPTPAQRRRAERVVHTQLDFNRDVFIKFPNQRVVDNAPPSYSEMFSFNWSDKFNQWLMLSGFMNTPQLAEPPYVIRPRNHHAGRGFRVVDTMPDLPHTHTHYTRSLFKRRWEYRVIFVRGRKCVVMNKQVPEDIAQDKPWNHDHGSTFVTVRDESNDRLRHTQFYQHADRFLQVYPYHLIAFDVLLNKEQGQEWEYAVTEVNFSPGLEIPENLTTISNALANSQH